MPKKPHSKFVVSADPYPAINTNKPEMIYQPPIADKQNDIQPEYEGDQGWELFLDSIIASENPDLTLNTPSLSLPIDHNQIEFDYPDIFEYHTSLDTEYDYKQGIQPDIDQEISMDKLFERDDSDKENDESASTQEPPYSELLEDDWDVGILRKEHSAEFQSDAGLDFGDEKQGEVDDDEGDVWNKEE